MIGHWTFRPGKAADGMLYDPSVVEKEVSRQLFGIASLGCLSPSTVIPFSGE